MWDPARPSVVPPNPRAPAQAPPKPRARITARPPVMPPRPWALVSRPLLPLHPLRIVSIHSVFGRRAPPPPSVSDDSRAFPAQPTLPNHPSRRSPSPRSGSRSRRGRRAGAPRGRGAAAAATCPRRPGRAAWLRVLYILVPSVFYRAVARRPCELLRFSLCANGQRADGVIVLKGLAGSSWGGAAIVSGGAAARSPGATAEAALLCLQTGLSGSAKYKIDDAWHTEGVITGRRHRWGCC